MSQPTNPTTDAVATEQQAPPQSFRQKLDAAEQHWKWKLSLRAFLIVVAIIGIGCMAWAVSTQATGPFAYELADGWALAWSLITFGVSALWCAVCVLVLVLRRPNKPVHPGVAVGLDLLLWLAFIPTAMFALIAAVSVLSFGAGGRIGQYAPYGYYQQAANGTWVYNQRDPDAYYQRDRHCSSGEGYSGYDGYGFDSCTEEDAYVNALWNAKAHRAGVVVTGTVCQFIGFVLHFVLFVWACVDTHRRKSKNVSKEAERLAANIVMNMVRSGAIVTTPAQGGMQQPLLHQQQYPQQYQGPPPNGWMNAGPAPMGQGPHPMMPPQATMRGSEKGDSARFA